MRSALNVLREAWTSRTRMGYFTFKDSECPGRGSVVLRLLRRMDWNSESSGRPNLQHRARARLDASIFRCKDIFLCL